MKKCILTIIKTIAYNFCILNMEERDWEHPDLQDNTASYGQRPEKAMAPHSSTFA